MAIEVQHLVIGGGTAMSMAGLLWRMRGKRTKPEYDAASGNVLHNVLLGIAKIEQSLLRVETSMAVIPSLREDVALHGEQIRSLRLDNRAIRDEIADIQRENETRDDRISRLGRGRDGD